MKHAFVWLLLAVAGCGGSTATVTTSSDSSEVATAVVFNAGGAPVVDSMITSYS